MPSICSVYIHWSTQGSKDEQDSGRGTADSVHTL